MKKISILIGIIFLLMGCQEEQLKDNTISKITERTMYEKRINQGITNQDFETGEDTSIPKEKEPEPEIISTQIIPEEKPPVEAIVPVDPNEVDTEAIDYQIHQGKIDCLTIDECIDISIPIQYELNNSIDDVIYLAVKNILNNPLGYFIVYTFRDYQYSDYDECLIKKNYLDTMLNDHISNSICREDGQLLINEDGEEVD